MSKTTLPAALGAEIESDGEFARVAHDGRRVLTASRYDGLSVWDTATGARVWSVVPGVQECLDAWLAPEGDRVIARLSKSLCAWIVGEKKPAFIVKGLAWDGGFLAVSHDGGVVATGGQGVRVPPGAVRRFDARTGEELAPLGVGAGWHASALAFSSDGLLLLCGTDEGALLALRAGDGSVAWEVPLALTKNARAPCSVQRVASTPASRVFAAVSDDALALFDAATGARVRTLRERRDDDHAMRGFALAYSADGSHLVSITREDRPRVWVAATGEEVRGAEGSRAKVVDIAATADVALAPDGAWMLVVQPRAPAAFWSTKTDEPLRPPLPVPASAPAIVAVPSEAPPSVKAPAPAALDREAALAKGFLRPSAGSIGAAIAAARTARKASEAWESLSSRGLIPSAWIDDPARRFHRGGLGGPEAWPQNIESCVHLAADVPGVERCELLAREAAARLAPWGIAPITSVVWRVDAVEGAYPASRPLEFVLRALRALPFDAAEIAESRRPRVRGAAHPAHLCSTCNLAAEGESLWNSAARAKLTLTARRKRFAPTEANNPFTPLLDLWALGYVPISLNGGRAVLFAPRTL